MSSLEALLIGLKLTLVLVAIFILVVLTLHFLGELVAVFVLFWAIISLYFYSVCVNKL